MITPSASSDPIGEPVALDPSVERCREVVDTLLDIGMRLVETLDPRRGPSVVRDPIQAYCRLARSLRLTMMLESRLAAVAAGGALAMAAERSLAEAADDAGEAEPDDEAEAGEAVEHGERGESARVDRDREGPDEISRYLNRPLAELAAAICRDLDLPAAEALEVEAAFANLIANDDAPEPAPAGTAPVGDPGEQRRRWGDPWWRGSRPSGLPP